MSDAPALSACPPLDSASEVEALRAEVARLRARNVALSARNRELRLSDSRLNCLLESEIIGVLIGEFTGEAGGTIARINRSFARMVGYEPEQLVGASDLWQSFVPPEESERYRQQLEKLRRSGVCAPWETTFLRPDGSRLPVLTGATLLESAPCYPDACERSLLVWAVDISERKNAENELRVGEARVGEARMRSIVENLRDGLLITDLDDTITYANQRMSEMCGHSNAELLGRNAHQMLSAPEHWERCRQRNRERAGGASETYEMPLLRKDGGMVWALINGSPLRDASGAIVGTIGAHSDITERKAGEAERARFARQLEESNRDLEAFAYAVSHDLKAPLRKIEAFGGRLEILEGAALQDESRDALARMRASAARMGALIDGLLLYSRAASEADGWRWVELDEVAREAMLDLEWAARGARVEIGPLPRLYAEPTQMRQLLQNLIGNALKYRRPEASPQVRVSGEVRENRVFLQVADNGRGFAAGDAEAIFEIFRRAPGAAPALADQAPVPGAGVGLTICRKIVERHGGRIRGASDGQGATFFVELPLGDAARLP